MATQSDDFNRASLGANGPNGNAWQGLGTWAVSASTVLLSPTDAQGNTLVYNTTFADCYIEVDVLDNPTSSYSGLCFRWTDNDNYFSAQWDTVGGNITIVKREAASGSTVAFWNEAITAPFNLKLRLSGDAFTVYIDDVDLGTPDSGTASSSFNNTATRHGFWHFGNSVTGGTFDNWLLDSDVTVAQSDSDSATFTEGGDNLDIGASDSIAASEVWGLAVDRGGRAIADRFRVTETESVTVDGVDPLLARPLYALIETPPLTATIIDYLEQIEDSDWRESGIDIDI
jgi:hypothetical protein